MPRWLPLTVFVTGVVTGAVLWLWFGEGTRLAAAGCDRPYCPSATAIHNSRYFIDAGRALFVVALVALIVWAVRAFRQATARQAQAAQADSAGMVIGPPPSEATATVRFARRL